jgi:hypothetical protein
MALALRIPGSSCRSKRSRCSLYRPHMRQLSQVSRRMRGRPRRPPKGGGPLEVSGLAWPETAANGRGQLAAATARSFAEASRFVLTHQFAVGGRRLQS